MTKHWAVLAICITCAAMLGTAGELGAFAPIFITEAIYLLLGTIVFEVLCLGAWLLARWKARTV